MRRMLLALSTVVVLLVSGVGLQPANAAEGYPPCTIVGSAAAETLTGTVGPDVICSGGGDDSIAGLGGDDIIIYGQPKLYEETLNSFFEFTNSIISFIHSG